MSIVGVTTRNARILHVAVREQPHAGGETLAIGVEGRLAGLGRLEPDLVAVVPRALERAAVRVVERGALAWRQLDRRRRRVDGERPDELAGDGVDVRLAPDVHHDGAAQRGQRVGGDGREDRLVVGEHRRCPVDPLQHEAVGEVPDRRLGAGRLLGVGAGDLVARGAHAGREVAVQDALDDIAVGDVRALPRRFGDDVAILDAAE
jgi:hypothetical protein